MEKLFKIIDYLAAIYIYPIKRFSGTINAAIEQINYPDCPFYVIFLIIVLVLYAYPWAIYHSKVRGRSEHEWSVLMGFREERSQFKKGIKITKVNWKQEGF